MSRSAVLKSARRLFRTSLTPKKRPSSFHVATLRLGSSSGSSRGDTGRYKALQQDNDDKGFGAFVGLYGMRRYGATRLHDILVAPLYGGGQGFESPRLHSGSRLYSGIPTPNQIVNDASLK